MTRTICTSSPAVVTTDDQNWARRGGATYFWGGNPGTDGTYPSFPAKRPPPSCSSEKPAGPAAHTTRFSLCGEVPACRNPHITPCQAHFCPPQIPQPIFICCRYTACTYTSVFQAIFCSLPIRLGPFSSYVQKAMHTTRPRKPSSLPHFRFFFHHSPQRPVDLPLLPQPHPNHPSPSAPDRGTPLFHAPRSPQTGDPPALP